MRLAAAGYTQYTEERAPLTASAAMQAAAAAAVVSPSPTLISQPITPLDEAAIATRLPTILARLLVTVLPQDPVRADLTLASIEDSWLARAKAGDESLADHELLQKTPPRRRGSSAARPAGAYDA